MIIQMNSSQPRLSLQYCMIFSPHALVNCGCTGNVPATETSEGLGHTLRAEAEAGRAGGEEDQSHRGRVHGAVPERARDEELSRSVS